VNRPGWKYRTGAKPSTAAQKAAALPAHEHPKIKAALAAHRSGAVPLPSSVDLSSYSPPILNQNVTGACVDHAFAGAVVTSLAAQAKPLGFVPSPLTLYAAVRGAERALTIPPGTTQIPKLTDSGSQVATVMSVAATLGVVPMVAPTPDGYNSDVWSGNVLDEPDTQKLQAAGQKLLFGPYLFDLTAPNASDVLATALSIGIAIQVAFNCDDAFQNLEPGQIAVAPVDAPDDGGHSVFLSGYYTLTAETAGLAVGTRIFLLTNSWGDPWCNGGRADVGPSWMANLWEAWAIGISSEGAVASS
jgi:hypothetical protein